MGQLDSSADLYLRATASTIAAACEASPPPALDFQDFFENGGMALHLVGSDGIILHANRAELELLGYAPEDYIGRHIAEYHTDRSVIEHILTRLTAGEKLQK